MSEQHSQMQGNKVDGLRTARDVLEADGRLAKDTVAARVDGDLYDLHTPLAEGSKDVVPISAHDPAALEIIRHSSAHIMADAVQRLYPGTRVTFGPATENGFYYDFDRPQGAFSDEELRSIEKEMGEIISKDHAFRREVISRKEARTMLEGMGETYKVEHLERIEEPISVYRHGDWVDLCAGPHVPSTRFLRAFKLTNVSGAYWRGDERNPMLQRIYGTAFPSEKALRAYLKQLEEAKKRDHRKLGKELEIFGFHPWAPASPFFLPRGAALYGALIDYVKSLYGKYAYDEVITPQVFDNELFHTSGHLPGYGQNMYFAATSEDFERWSKSKEETPSARFGLKPMNCPGHALMFGFKRRSYRELPMRIADFGRLHRYERSGVIQGLTRVRTFVQDDGHIFCTREQMQSEMTSFLELVYEVYSDFGFQDVRVVVATRPDDRIGSDENWDQAENAAKKAVESKGLPVEIAEGEGAFYGPKIEFHLKDALGRPWQLGTVQVDFNLPERFDLSYTGVDNASHRPVMLHRAILGSAERFLAVLIEHCAGAFPVWLAPEQITLLTVSEKWNEHAEKVKERLSAQGVRVSTDLSADKLGAKIRKARLLRVPYLAVIGEREVEEDTLSVRSRDEQKELGAVKVDEMCQRILAESKAPSLRSLS